MNTYKINVELVEMINSDITRSHLVNLKKNYRLCLLLCFEGDFFSFGFFFFNKYDMT
jgi:hypothetical protein